MASGGDSLLIQIHDGTMVAEPVSVPDGIEDLTDGRRLVVHGGPKNLDNIPEASSQGADDNAIPEFVPHGEGGVQREGVETEVAGEVTEHDLIDMKGDEPTERTEQAVRFDDSNVNEEVTAETKQAEGVETAETVERVEAGEGVEPAEGIEPAAGVEGGQEESSGPSADEAAKNNGNTASSGAKPKAGKGNKKKKGKKSNK